MRFLPGRLEAGPREGLAEWASDKACAQQKMERSVNGSWLKGKGNVQRQINQRAKKVRVHFHVFGGNVKLFNEGHLGKAGL